MTADALERIFELAKTAAFTAHCEDSHGPDPYETCKHPDCALVRAGGVERTPERCVIGEYCSRHGFIHGAEAEELRSRVETILAQVDHEGDDAAEALDRALRVMLDEIDARDSVSFLARGVVEPPAPSKDRIALLELDARTRFNDSHDSGCQSPHGGRCGCGWNLIAARLEELYGNQERADWLRSSVRGDLSDDDRERVDSILALLVYDELKTHARVEPPAQEPRLSVEDIDQIVEGIEHFVIGPFENAELDEIWRPYINKLNDLRADIQLRGARPSPPPATPQEPPHYESGNCPHCGAWVDFAQEHAIEALPAAPHGADTPTETNLHSDKHHAD